MDPQQQRRGAGAASVVWQYQPAADRVAVVGGRGYLGDPPGNPGDRTRRVQADDFPGGQVDADRGGRLADRVPQRVQRRAVRGGPEVRVVRVVAGLPGDLAAGEVHREYGPAAGVVGGEVDGSARGIPGRPGRPPVEAGQQVGPSWEQHQGAVAGRVRGVVCLAEADNAVTVRREHRVAVVEPGAAVPVGFAGGGDDGTRAGGDVDGDQLRMRLHAVPPAPPARRHRRAVRAKRDRLLGQGPAGIRGQVPGRVFPARAAGDDYRGEDPQVVGPEIVVPVPHGQRVVQDRGDPGVFPGLPPRLVLGGRPGQGRPGHDDRRRAGRRLRARDAAGQGGRLPGFAPAGRQEPERRLVVGVPAVARAVRSLRVRALGREQQRAVGQEPRVSLAVGRPGQPGRRAAGRVDPPDAGDVLLLVRAEGLDGAASQVPSGASRNPVTRGIAR